MLGNLKDYSPNYTVSTKEIHTVSKLYRTLVESNNSTVSLVYGTIMGITYPPTIEEHTCLVGALAYILNLEKDEDGDNLHTANNRHVNIKRFESADKLKIYRPSDGGVELTLYRKIESVTTPVVWYEIKFCKDSAEILKDSTILDAVLQALLGIDHLTYRFGEDDAEEFRKRN